MYYCEIWDSYPFSFSSMDTRQLQFLLFDYWTLYSYVHITVKYGTRPFLLFVYLTLYGQVALKYGTTIPFFFFVRGHYRAMLLWNTGQLLFILRLSIDTIRPQALLWNLLDTMRPYCCEYGTLTVSFFRLLDTVHTV